MAREEVTSIEVKKSTWKTLNQQKEPGDSFDDVIQRLLQRPEEQADPEPVKETDDTTPDEQPIYDCPDCEWTGDDWDEFQTHLESHDL